MTSCTSSEYTPYQRPKHGLIQTSSSNSTEHVSSSNTDINSQSITTFRPSTSTAQRKSKFLSLIRYIGNAIATLQSTSGFSSLPTAVISQIDGETSEFLGRGKTFHVSRLPLPATLELKNSWPKRLVIRPPVGDLLLRTYHANPITCKRPMIEFDSCGNPKQGAVEGRLEAVILEVWVLTHPPIYFHKNIVDFLGISWQCELPEVEPGQTVLPPKRVPVILLEYAKHGSLEAFMQTPFLCRNIAEGLAVLHKHRVVHGDIKPDNILIFEADEKDTSVAKAFGLRAKLTDFGFSVGLSVCDGTDRFSLKGLWTLLAKKDIGALFGLEGKDYHRSNPEIREEAERLKDWTLSSNASTYFKHGGKMIETLVQSLFRCSLEPDANRRGSMEDILRIWDTWFVGNDSYVSIPPGITLRPELGLQRIETVSFQRIVVEAKRLIDECASTHPPVAIFQPMFFDMNECRSFTSASKGECTEYEQQAFKGLMTMARTTNSYEVFQQLMRYFPMPKNASYSRLRSINHRIHLYGIPEFTYPDALSQEKDKLVAGQMADIERFHRTAKVLALGHSAFHYAVSSDFAEAVDLILQMEGFRTEFLEFKDALGFTPLLSACRLGNFRIAKLLIGAGANVTARTRYGETILHFLCEFDNPDEMSEIADVIMARDRGALCIDSTSEMQEYLLGCGVGKEADGSYPDVLTNTVGAGKLMDASTLLAAGVSIDELTTKGGGWTTLGLIVRTCAYNSVALYGITDLFGLSVLHVAALIPFTTPFYDRIILSNVVDYLLDKFCSPEHLNAQDKDGCTPLHVATLNGNCILIRRLLAFDTIDTTIRAHDGASIYDCALHYESTGVPEFISNMGARAVKGYTDDMRDTMALLHPLRGY
ncbi:uncharacterized protein H6S33_010671 [Morchella sextelata]|uniref:uncharacterized protein n=1 Tax=Morchella sextelata TaxID=1174677 RepID=UPI001D04042C|nr:uncharacterized protein H6S33_010671 [Morchella sextelata]KAH0611406.1 hypothetical protein H6S33_010671 [Morchella sextelata]